MRQRIRGAAAYQRKFFLPELQEDLILEETFFLCYGRGPFKSFDEVERLPARVRRWFVERLSDQYREEERQMKSAARRKK